MNLHNDKETFRELLEKIAKHMNISEIAMVEKDYFITYFLNEIAKRQPGIVFKGGTSLSKSHKIINRFSEDIDLSLEPKTDKVTESQRRKLKKDIIEIIEESGFILENAENIRSRRDLNRYFINYNSRLSTATQNYLEKNLIVETSVFIKSFPNETKEVSSLVYDYLKANSYESSIEKYGLTPFEITVQSLKRTFADKIFAIADYYMSGKSKRLSRHIYDLYKIYPEIKFDENYTNLVAEIRMVRKTHNTCFSAQDGVCIQDILKKIVSEDYYKSDYEQITQSMMFEDVEYSKAITVIGDVIKIGCFDERNE
jgi:predicted nucleotidyltransferase component of viral defense system